jgi:hypothetical protein
MVRSGCVLCQGQWRCSLHKHFDGGILVLLPPPNKEAKNYRLAFFWAEDDKVRHVALPVGDWQEAKARYHLALCAGRAEKVREIVIQLARPPIRYGAPPPRPTACGHCGGQQLEAIDDLFGGYWSCLTCGATSDPDTVPPDVLLEIRGQ